MTIAHWFYSFILPSNHFLFFFAFFSISFYLYHLLLCSTANSLFTLFFMSKCTEHTRHIYGISKTDHLYLSYSCVFSSEPLQCTSINFIDSQRKRARRKRRKFHFGVIKIHQECAYTNLTTVETRLSARHGISVNFEFFLHII